MRKEIHDIIGESRFPSLEDRSKLPFCDAVLFETLRLGGIAPFSVPHGLTRDLKFNGHLIPKDAMILPCLDSILNDPKLFENPFIFNPDRFLDENGKLKGTEKVLTFGLGKSLVSFVHESSRKNSIHLTDRIKHVLKMPYNANVCYYHRAHTFVISINVKTFSFNILQVVVYAWGNLLPKWSYFSLPPVLYKDSDFYQTKDVYCHRSQSTKWASRGRHCHTHLGL